MGRPSIYTLGGDLASLFFPCLLPSSSPFAKESSISSPPPLLSRPITGLCKSRSLMGRSLASNDGISKEKKRTTQNSSGSFDEEAYLYQQSRVQVDPNPSDDSSFLETCSDYSLELYRPTAPFQRRDHGARSTPALLPLFLSGLRAFDSPFQ